MCGVYIHEQMNKELHVPDLMFLGQLLPAVQFQSPPPSVARLAGFTTSRHCSCVTNKLIQIIGS